MIHADHQNQNPRRTSVHIAPEPYSIRGCNVVVTTKEDRRYAPAETASDINLTVWPKVKHAAGAVVGKCFRGPSIAANVGYKELKVCLNGQDYIYEIMIDGHSRSVPDLPNTLKKLYSNNNEYYTYGLKSGTAAS